MTEDMNEVRSSWDSKANDWKKQVGDQGDWNRRLNSDPVLFEMLGRVRHRSILDDGCGTGYLSNKLDELGADVIGVDLSPEMIRIARQEYPELDFRVEDCTKLSTVEDGEMDLVVSNYVLMDTPNLTAAVTAMFRVLRPRGVAVVIFSHPCFPQADCNVHSNGSISYDWKHSYYEPSRQQDAPWKHFKSDFIWYHRPLEEYWRAFRSAGFQVDDFQEPHITPDNYHLAPNMTLLETYKERPISVAFKLIRPNR